jgi:Family of unknown function (DUF5678)
MPGRIRQAVWRVVNGLPYRRGMGVARGSDKIPPVPRAQVLDKYAGQWVAIKDGRVIAHSPSSREVVRQMRRLGAEAEGAILQRAAEPTEALAVGLG